MLKVHLSTLSQQIDTEEDEQKITQTQRPLKFCEPKGQELIHLFLAYFGEFFETPGPPLECVYIALKKIVSSYVQV